MKQYSITILLALIGMGTQCVPAQNYPNRTIRLIVPSLPGGSVDILGRIVAQKLGEQFGQQVVVDNRAGAGGIIGVDLVAKSTPDGYTILVGQGGNFVVAPHTFKNIPYDPIKDFVPVALSATNFLGFVVHPKVPFKSVKDLIIYARANPGGISFASAGEGSWGHLATELLRMQAGFSYLHVPYKGIAQFATDLIAGQVDASIIGFTGLVPHIRSGRLRLLGVTNPTRVPNFPDVPAIAETLPGYESRGWFGFLAPGGTPREIITRLNQEINRANTLLDVKEKLAADGLIILTESPEYFAATIKSDYVKYGKLIRDIGFHSQ